MITRLAKYVRQQAGDNPGEEEALYDCCFYEMTNVQVFSLYVDREPYSAAARAMEEQQAAQDPTMSSDPLPKRDLKMAHAHQAVQVEDVPEESPEARENMSLEALYPGHLLKHVDDGPKNDLEYVKELFALGQKHAPPTDCRVKVPHRGRRKPGQQLKDITVLNVKGHLFQEDSKELNLSLDSGANITLIS
jgi:hypothetical protein